MENIERTLKVNDNRIIKFYITENYTTRYSLTEYFIEDDEISKSYTLSRWDDYQFTGWKNISLKEKECINSISYDFDTKHPLYIPLLHLLKDDEYLLIDDDDTLELNKKYMVVKKEEDKISLTFTNNLEKDDIYNKFSTFIKNTCRDSRSKIYYEDTKERLNFFFKEITDLCLEDRHQISMEEYLLNTRNSEDEEVKKYVKNMIPRRNTTFIKAA